MSTIEIAVQVLLLLAVGVVLALAGIGLWAVHTRRRAWADYEKQRARWLDGGAG